MLLRSEVAGLDRQEKQLERQGKLILHCYSRKNKVQLVGHSTPDSVWVGGNSNEKLPCYLVEKQKYNEA